MTHAECEMAARKLTASEREWVRYFLLAGWSPVKAAGAVRRKRSRDTGTPYDVGYGFGNRGANW